MLKHIYTSTKTISGSLTGNMFFISAHDCIWAYGVTSARKLDRIYRDGTVVAMGEAFWLNAIHITSIGDKVVLGLGNIVSNNQLYNYDPISWTTDLNNPLGPIFGSFVNGDGVIIPNREGVLKIYTPYITGYRRWDLDTRVLEDTVSGVLTGNVTAQLQWLQDQQIVAWNKTTGELAVWDVDAQAPRLRSFTNPGSHIVVDRTHGNVITINASRQTEVYELAVAASAVSALSFSPGNFDRYHGESVSVTITGSNGELVVDQDIEWTLALLPADTVAVNSETLNTFSVDAAATHPPAKGCIHPQFTKTDAAGIARATYCPPGNDWVINEREVVSAKVAI